MNLEEAIEAVKAAKREYDVVEKYIDTPAATGMTDEAKAAYRAKVLAAKQDALAALRAISPDAAKALE